MRRKIVIFGLGLLVILFVIFPDTVSRGAERGLMLWFKVIIPSLLPFMIVSTLLIKLRVTGYISTIFYPIFHRLFGISKEGCYPAVVGMLSGYPLGAKTVADMYLQDGYSRKEAQYLLGFSNNASPMFMLEYIGVKCMHLHNPVIVLAIIYLSAFINALCEQYKTDDDWQRLNKNGNIIEVKNYPVMEALDESILNAAITLFKVGGYIILFSIIVRLLQYMIPVPGVVKVLGSGMLEITTGAESIVNCKISHISKCIMLTGFCAFGGLSSVAQTASVLIGTGLSVRRYMIVKFRQSIIAVIIAGLVFTIL